MSTHTNVSASDRYTGRRLKVITWNVTSSSGGAYSEATTQPVVGLVRRFVAEPGTSGDQPTDAFDVTIKDSHGIDVLGGGGANIANAAASDTEISTPVAVASTLTCAVTNAGDTKKATLTLYVE